MWMPKNFKNYDLLVKNPRLINKKSAQDEMLRKIPSFSYNEIRKKMNDTDVFFSKGQRITRSVNRRIKSSYIRPNKLNYGFINSLSQTKLLNDKINGLKKYEIKDNIISNILDNIGDNKSINNNLVSQLYKRPLINIYTLLELKNNNADSNYKKYKF